MISTLALMLGCASPPGGAVKGAAEGGGEGAVDSGGAPSGDGAGGGEGGTGDSGGEGDSAVEEGPCPRQMVLIDAQSCMDMAEAALEERVDGGWAAASPYETVDGREVRAVVALGAVPQGYISGIEASAACEAAGKRLCTSEEWLRACQGSTGTTWPYGDSYQEGACNDRYAGGHPVVDYFGTSDGVWDSEHMNDPGINQQPGTVATGGEYSACISEDGLYDMHGNLHEWVADEEGTFRGGFYADAEINGPGCTYTTTAHDTAWHDYSTGFRCCADPS